MRTSRFKGQMWRLFFVSSLLFTGIVYLTPQLIALNEGRQGTFLLKADEPGYSARVVRFVQGHWKIGDPWSFEGRENPTLIPSLPEWVIGGFTKLLRLDFYEAIWITRFIFPILSVIFLYLSARLSGGMRMFCLAAAITALADPGVFYYKPWIGAFRVWSEHPLNRFSNPIFGLSIFLLTWLLWLKAVEQKEKNIRSTILAGAATGSLFYISFYYWSHIICTLALFLFRKPSWGMARKILTGGLAAFVVALPYFINVLEAREHPQFQWVSWRIGFWVKDSGHYLLKHRALWLWLFLGLIMYLGIRKQNRFWGAGILAGCGLYFSTLVTGMSLQNYHWHHTLAPLAIGALFVFASTSPSFKIQNDRVASGICLIAIVLSITAGLRTGYAEFKTIKGEPGLGYGYAPYEKSFNWLKVNGHRDAVVIAELPTQLMVPLNAGLRTWNTSSSELVSFEETAMRFHLLWFCSRLKRDDLLDRISPKVEPPVPQWIYGMSSQVLNRLVSQNKPMFNKEVSVYVATELANEHFSLDKARLGKSLKNLKADYLVVGPNESSWDQGCADFFKTLKVFEGDGVVVLKILSWRN